MTPRQSKILYAIIEQYAEVASPVGIPSEFNLLISGTRSGRRCQLMWRKENRIGVAFKD